MSARVSVMTFFLTLKHLGFSSNLNEECGWVRSVSRQDYFGW